MRMTWRNNTAGGVTATSSLRLMAKQLGQSLMGVIRRNWLRNTWGLRPLSSRGLSMSAWVVSRLHIDYIVAAAIAAKKIRRTEADAIGRMLWQECLASVTYRYPNDKDGKRPGPNDFRDRMVDEYTYSKTPVLAAGALKKTLGCYRYQSCEHPGWVASKAHNLIESLLETVSHAEDDELTPWGW